MFDDIKLILVEHNTCAYFETVDLRYQILRKPLKLQFSTEELQAENDSLHVTMLENNKLVGCLVLKPLDLITIQMRQVAILPTHQGMGLGRKLVSEAEKIAKLKGFRKIILHARLNVEPFYLGLQYHTKGEPFIEVSIPHVTMEKEL